MSNTISQNTENQMKLREPDEKKPYNFLEIMQLMTEGRKDEAKKALNDVCGPHEEVVRDAEKIAQTISKEGIQYREFSMFFCVINETNFPELPDDYIIFEPNQEIGSHVNFKLTRDDFHTWEIEGETFALYSKNPIGR